MVAQQLIQQTPATTDALGNVEFVFPYQLASDKGWQGTVSIGSGQAGTFTAQDASGIKWGTWSGSQPFGPVTVQGNIRFTIDGSGLQPNTQYIAHFIGTGDLIANLTDAPAPTALGASSLVGTDVIIDETTFALAAPSSQDFRYFPCINFSSMRLAAVLASGGPVLIEATWFNSDATAQMGYRRYIIGPSAPTLEVVVPHLGDQLEIRLTNSSGFDATFSLCATHTTHVLYCFGGLDGYATGPITVAPGTTLVIEPSFIYGGPAILNVDAAALSTGSYEMALQEQTPTGGFTDIESRTDADGPRLSLPLFLPAAPLRVTIINSTGSPQPMSADLMLDLHRSG